MTSEACSIAVAIVVVGMVKNLLSYCNAIIKIVSMYYYGNILCFHFYCAMLCIRGTSRGPVSVRLSVCLSVSLSVTSRCSTRTAKRRITQTKPHAIAQEL